MAPREPQGKVLRLRLGAWVISRMVMRGPQEQPNGLLACAQCCNASAG